MNIRTQQHFFCYPVFFVFAFLSFATIRFGLFFIEKNYGERVDQVTTFPASSQVYDREGNLLYEFIGEVRRIPVEAEAIPQVMRDATLVAEDQNFFSHTGFDPFGIGRAFLRNLISRQQSLEAGLSSYHREGGSTIGQQLVKNTVLGPSQGYMDKLDELFFSIAIDARFSKEDILHSYLNTIPYGSNVYGVEAAARHYFGKSISKITVAEAAILAALPKHPSYLSPYGDNLDELHHRKEYILYRLLEQEYIDEALYHDALNEELVFADPGVKVQHPYFVFHVKQLLEERYGREVLEQQGLSIITTLDPHLQAIAQTSITNQENLLTRHWADSVGATAIDPQTGEVLAMVGNQNYFGEADFSQFNTTTALRQPGSSFKPVAYAALLEKQAFTPASILYDIPKNFSKDPLKPYIPQNYDLRFRGPVTIRDALAQSLNVPAVQALELVGLDGVIDLATDLGITTFSERERFGPSLVLGGGEVSLLELTNVYATFADAGVYKDPQVILSITDQDGDSLDWWGKSPHVVLRPETAYQLTSMLSDNKARAPVFGARSSLAFDQAVVAAKTGTSQDYRDAWTIGYSSELAIGVWVGNHDNQPMRYNSPGALVAGPIFHDIMEQSFSTYQPQEFARPKYLEQKTIYTIVGRREEFVAPWQVDPFKRPLVRSTILLQP